MSELDNIKELEIPTLTLDITDEAGVESLAAVTEKLPAKDAEEYRREKFTEAELAQITEFAGKIDIHDTNQIVSYGAGAQKKLSDFSDVVLENMKTKDMDEIGGMLSTLVADLKYSPEEEHKGLFGFLKKSENKAELMKAHYAKVGNNIEQVTNVLENHQQTLIRDIATMDQLFDKNKTYFKELSMYIAAGKIALDKAYNEELPALKATAEESGLAEDAQIANDFAALCERFEKKLYDLDLTRAICLQNAPQIRLVQNNAVMMSDKIQTAIVNTIPLWKNQMVISMGLAHSESAVKAQNMVNATTNNLLKKNAELLQQTSIEVAQENEKGIIELETLQETNQRLLTTLDEIVKIQEEGRTKRQEAEAELGSMEEKLRAKLLDVTAPRSVADADVSVTIETDPEKTVEVEAEVVEEE